MLLRRNELLFLLLLTTEGVRSLDGNKEAAAAILAAGQGPFIAGENSERLREAESQVFVEVEVEQETKVYHNVESVGQGIVYKVESEEPTKLQDPEIPTRETSWKFIIEETDSVLRQQERAIKELQVRIQKLYTNRLAVSDSNDSNGIRKGGISDYIKMMYNARRVLCPHLNCSYGVCFLKEELDIEDIDVEAAIKAINADWTSRVENPNEAFRSHGSNAVIQQNAQVQPFVERCEDSPIVTRTIDGGDVFSLSSFCAVSKREPQDELKKPWSPYIFRPEQIALIDIMYRKMGMLMPTRESLKDLADLFTTCACYKGFHGSKCDKCVCSGTPGIYDNPVKILELDDAGGIEEEEWIEGGVIDMFR